MSAPLGSDQCSIAWDSMESPVWGTAGRASFIIALEQSGPWGRVAATQSRLDVIVGRALDERVTDLGGRLLLIRRPGRHAVPRQATPTIRTVILARTGPHGWLVVAEVTDPAVLLDLDQTHLRDAVSAARWLGGRVEHAAILLVCTHGRRDPCCATRGRPIAAHAHRLRPAQVWETSHTGGHRFAPTGFLLPWGRALARLDEAVAAEVLQAADRGELAASVLGPDRDRGGLHLPAPLQAAEAWLRHREGRASLSDPVEEDARSIPVRATRALPCPTSCGAAPVRAVTYTVSDPGPSVADL